MKIVALSDTHMRHKEITLPEGDILVHLGDYVVGWEGNIDNDLIETRDWLLSHADRYSDIICLVGNHDPMSAPQNLKVEGIHYLHDSNVTIDGIEFAGTPWSTPGYGRYNATEEEIRNRLIPMGSCDILLSHSPPYRILDKSPRGMSTGSRSILKYVKTAKPKYHLFGHCHNTAGQSIEVDKTTFINVSIPKDEHSGTGGPVVIDF